MTYARGTTNVSINEVILTSRTASANGGQGLPAMRQQFLDPTGSLCGEPARWPARKLPAKSQFDRTRAMGRIWFYTRLLSA